MTSVLGKQYDSFTEDFVAGTQVFNEISRKAYYNILETIDFQGKKVLDIGCGDGYDIGLLGRKGALMYGVDASESLVREAQKSSPSVDIVVGDMRSLPFPDSYFDVVISKYTIQTAYDVKGVIAEMDRVLKVGGTMFYLAVHPLRQFLEKKRHPKDYFIQEVVASTFFGGTVTAHEPTHTLEEYVNPEFLHRYRLRHFREYADFPSSEKIDGDTYPCFFVLGAEKEA